MTTIYKRSKDVGELVLGIEEPPTLSKNFTRKADAMKWARDTEILIEQKVIN